MLTMNKMILNRFEKFKLTNVQALKIKGGTSDVTVAADVKVDTVIEDTILE